jgi:nucleotide-binding universal stress UspA family protein
LPADEIGSGPDEVRTGANDYPRMAAHARQILVGYDGSEASQRALDAAADLAGYGSTLAVVHVLRAGAPQGRTVELAREHLLQRHLTARYLEPCGHPAQEIVEAARAVSADLIVVGRRNALRRMLGSVSASVVHRAPCDVLVVR